MAAYKICSLLLCFILLQGALCQPQQPLPQQETELEAIAHEKLRTLINKYSDKLAGLTQDVLKDETLLNNHDREVEELKESFSYILISYFSDNSEDSKASLLHYFANIPQEFDNIPEEKASWKAMKEVLERHGLLKLSREVKEGLDKIKALMLNADKN